MEISSYSARKRFSKAAASSNVAQIALTHWVSMRLSVSPKSSISFAFLSRASAGCAGPPVPEDFLPINGKVIGVRDDRFSLAARIAHLPSRSNVGGRAPEGSNVGQQGAAGIDESTVSSRRSYEHRLGSFGPLAEYREGRLPSIPSPKGKSFRFLARCRAFTKKTSGPAR